MDRRGDRAHRRPRSPTEQTARSWDLDAALPGDARALRLRRSPPTSCARTASTARARGAHRGLPRGRAGGVHGEGGAARRGADARARALRDPPGRRHALARAPRDRWTTCARASTCARWPRRTRSSSTRPRATRCSRSFAGDPRGGRASRSSTPSSRPRTPSSRSSSRGAGGERRASATSTSRSPAPTRSRPPAAARRRRRRSRRRGGSVARSSVVVDEHDEDRPQRPVLVRLGQEVQEVPRRVDGRGPREPPSPRGRASDYDAETSPRLATAPRRLSVAPVHGLTGPATGAPAASLPWPMTDQQTAARAAARGDRGPARLGP